MARLLLAVLLTTLATSASAQTGAPIRLRATFGVGSASDSRGNLIAVQTGVGLQKGLAAARVRGAAASDLALFSGRDRWEVAALGGVALGDRAQVFVGAGPGLTGGIVRQGLCFSAFCPDDEVVPQTLGLALALDGTVQVGRLGWVGMQAWANVNGSNPVAGFGLAVGLGG